MQKSDGTNPMEEAAAMMSGIFEELTRQLPAVRYSETQESECEIRMNDGVNLHAKIFMPKEGMKWPVVLMRNPYVGNNMINNQIYGPMFAKYGYAYVNVDVRGTLQSKGEWLPFENEREDGRAVIDWIAKQLWCDGNIGTMGDSYLGHVQWCIADYIHPMLKTMYIGVYGIHPYHTFYRRGMFRKELWTTWAAQMMGENRGRLFMPADLSALQQKAYAVSPQLGLGEELTGENCSWYEKWITSTKENDPYWSENFWKDLENVTENVSIPIHLQGGWFDIFLRSQIESYRRLPKEVKEKSRFVIGPWAHAGVPGGTLEYPDADYLGAFQLKAALEWFDYQLKGMEYPHSLGGIKGYSIRENRWMEWKEDFPAGRKESWYFDSETLSLDNPDQETRRTYQYNPEQPVQSLGGTMLNNNRNPMQQPECSVEQPEVGERADVISYVSKPFKQDTFITGAIEAHVFVSSSASATAFTVKVIEVFEDGRNMNIRDDITDIRWPDEEEVKDYAPGDIRELSLTLLDISWKIAKGSKLRVDISSSNFPAYHVHPNVTSCWANTKEKRVVEQVVYSGGRYPSRIVLPVINEKERES